MTTGYEKEEDKRGKQRPRWDRRVIRSLGACVHVVPMERRVAVLRRERKVTHVNITCEWSHSYDESEWSLMTSLIRRLGFP